MSYDVLKEMNFANFEEAVYLHCGLLLYDVQISILITLSFVVLCHFGRTWIFANISLKISLSGVSLLSFRTTIFDRVRHMKRFEIN